MPGEVIRRAREILASVEKTATAVRAAGSESKEAAKEKEQKEDDRISLDDCLREQVLEELRNTDLNTLSPFECMQLLFDWKKRLP